MRNLIILLPPLMEEDIPRVMTLTLSVIPWCGSLEEALELEGAVV